MHDSQKIPSKIKSPIRRKFLKVSISWALLFSAGNAFLPLPANASDEKVPPEPENLDQPTQWQEGDPEPYEAKVPEIEPEQTSTEAPPSQPIDEDRPDKPGDEYEWVYGYWWWYKRAYVWVPGYWAIPPRPNYVYIGGYWGYRGSSWVYVRGGWGVVNSTKVVIYASPRPVIAAYVYPAPARIVRRHYHWNHYYSRRYYHHPRPPGYRAPRTPVKHSVTLPEKQLPGNQQPPRTPVKRSITTPTPHPGPQPRPRPRR